MTPPILTPIRLKNGTWHGHLSAETEPRIEVRYLGQKLDGVALSPTKGGWALSVEVPTAALSDGVHSFLIVDRETSRKLADFTVIAGMAAADDIRAEVNLLRAELDMLKRAFRRVQTSGD
ncbi:hypothetical protein RUESEDTHA_03636 [Ruegeria sp. THAF57]|uniref:hypothetical protein n=1 Tax=Ruegeria sp. THAF57 TaxID=2744555 RepID=UPI0015DFC045|nr:hypothetical protein [Ruegeria sp. THAF57]CAD0186726.1 hypothetical protein RUESEDTHA_03636 [Ruegeria sp. THAF57]